MTFLETDGDFGLLSPVSASPLVAALTGDRAVLGAILKVEAAWAAVLDEAGLAPAGSAAVVAAAADVRRYDVAGIAVRAQGGGNPVIPLLADLREQVSNLDTAGLGAVQAIHTSLTSQDVLDSALMVLAAGAIRELLAELRAATAALAGLAEAHAHTLCVARSLTQHSLPYTFGLRAAQWFSGLAAAASRLEALELPVQTGGAAGTLASGTVLTDGTGLTDGAGLAAGTLTAATLSPFDLADRLAARLGLAPVPAPWHTNRLAVTALGDALAAVTDSAGKMAADVLFLSRPEVAEIAEPRAAGRGVSSAMPQKQNPVLSVLIRSAALQAPALAAQLHLAAANFNDERPDGAWHSEWAALRQLLRLALGAAGQLRELAEGMAVFPGAMRRNLGLGGPLLLSEAVTAAVAPLLDGAVLDGSVLDGRGAGTGADRTGKQRLQAVVDETLRAPAADQADTYRALLRAAVPEELLTDARLEELLNPANYLGQSVEISRRILAAYPEYTGQAGAIAHQLQNGASRG
ncbi:lyase family protein [Arthrobacter sp. 131MFCol6.1]|uniref:lyase family protein n=1 Tax=Arthrobacter sp. 131MFCol6.1 TaxID=1157944 RepID=UPI000375D128|nr:lyase family protein [Arthrobacter sp. 131MFCol6.1]